jgi:hypothetical protein
MAGQGVTRGDVEEGKIPEHIRCEEVIEEFFGQLWVIDSPSPRKPRVHPSEPTQIPTSNSDERLF